MKLSPQLPDDLQTIVINMDDSSRLGFVGDRIVERLSGQAAHDGTSAGLTLLYNPRKRAYDPEVLARLGLDARQLPVLSGPRSAAGGLRPEVARRTGMTHPAATAMQIVEARTRRGGPAAARSTARRPTAASRAAARSTPRRRTTTSNSPPGCLRRWAKRSLRPR